MTARRADRQFWSTSALVALVFQEPHTATALLATEAASDYLAWDWIRVEARAALARRRAKPADQKTLATLFSSFQFIDLDSKDYDAVASLGEKHRLRAADAGQLFCLLKAKKLFKKIEFVCFDEELVNAAEAERVAIFGR